MATNSNPPAGAPSTTSEQQSTGGAVVSTEEQTETVHVGSGQSGGRAQMGSGPGSGQGNVVTHQPVTSQAQKSDVTDASAPQVPDPHSSPSPAMQMSALGRRPRVLLAASGSVAAIKFSIIAQGVGEWAEVKAVCTKAALHFVEPSTLPADVPLYTDEDEWRKWSKLGDTVLHIELQKWADIMVVAPLSANTLAKLAGGICDNLLTCVVRAWDFRKPLLVAPAMNTHMWDSPFTAKHLEVLKDLGVALASPISKTLACGDVGTGAMAEPATIEAAIRKAVVALDLRSESSYKLTSP